jgi:protocatechuate 3,4-dioxygenase beta subunit
MIRHSPLGPVISVAKPWKLGSSGEWRIITIKPSGYDSPIGHRTPHIHFDIKGRHQRLITQMYFSEDHATNSADQLYNQLGEDAVTAMAARQATDRYRWDIVLGEG